MLNTRRKGYTFLENIIRILEATGKPAFKENVKNTLSMSGTNFKKYLEYVLDKGLVTYIDDKIVGKAGRGNKGGYVQLLVITDDGKTVLRLWLQLMAVLGLRDDPWTIMLQ